MSPDIIAPIQIAVKKVTGRTVSRPILNKPNVALCLLSGTPKSSAYGMKLVSLLESYGVFEMEEVLETKVKMTSPKDVIATTYVSFSGYFKAPNAEGQGEFVMVSIDPLGTLTITS